MLLNIQALRALAATMVVWVHAQEVLPSMAIPAWAASFGYGGVDLFFVISGFIMAYTTAGRPARPLDFLLRRLKRVAPLYYAVTLVVVAAALIAPQAFRGTAASLSDLLQSVLFIPFEKQPGRIYPLYFLGWTLNYEMAFYLLFSLGLLLPAAFRTPVMVGVLLLLAAVGTQIDSQHTAGVAAYVYTRPIILDFGAGMVIAALARTSLQARVAPGICWAAMALAALWFVGGGAVLPYAPEAAAPPTATFLRFGVPSILLVSAAIVLERQGRVLRSPPLQLLGDASYSLYLSHFLIIAPVVVLANRLDAPNALRPGLTAMAMALSLIGGVLVWRFVERPLSGDWSAFAAVRRWAASLRRRRQAQRPALKAADMQASADAE